MNELELMSTVFIVGVSIPIFIYGIYWFTLDQAKNYVDDELQEQREELREYTRKYNE